MTDRPARFHSTLQRRIKSQSPWIWCIVIPIFAAAILFWGWVLFSMAFSLFHSLFLAHQNGLWLALFPLGIIILICIYVVPALVLPVLDPSRYLARTYKAVVVNDDSSFSGVVAEVNRLSSVAGIRPVRYICIALGHRNAYAFGLLPSRMAIVLGEDLISLMKDDPEGLHAIIGHEIGHIASGDTQISTMALVSRDTVRLGIVAPLAVVAGYFGLGFLGLGDSASRTDDDNSSVSSGFYMLGLMFLLFTFLIWAAAWIVLTIVNAFQCAHSRRREFMADRAGAILTSRAAMIDALNRLEEITNGSDSRAPDPLGPIQIMNFSPRGMWGLFATHPSTAARIERLLSWDDLE